MTELKTFFNKEIGVYRKSCNIQIVTVIYRIMPHTLKLPFLSVGNIYRI